MANILRRENDLTVLRISLDRRGVEEGRGRTRHPESAIVVEVQVGTDDPVRGGRVPVSAIGLHDPVLGNERPAQFRLPDEVLQGPLSDLVGDQGAVWLEMPAPCGHLRLVPWEALLTEALSRPVLRLPYFSLLPQASREPLEVAVCASSPRAKTGFDATGMLIRYVDAVGRAVHQRRMVHIFADVDQYYPLIQEWQGQSDIVVHDPHAAEQFELPERTPEIGTGANVRNPWLLWMLDELGDRALDAVHFICHGYFAVDRGAIALASSPLVNTDATYSRFIGAAELGSFLITTGAWSIGLTGPEHNYAPLGLREVADSLAQTRPLHVVAHEAGEDPQLDEIEAAYGLMFATDPRPPPLLRASALWVHPKLVVEARQPATEQLAGDQWLDEEGGTTLLGSATKQALHGEVTPAWVAASARVIEQAQGDLLSPLGTTRSRVLETASHEDVATALRVAANLLERHVIADSTPETGAGGQAQGTP
jgi:hypothetical protein